MLKAFPYFQKLTLKQQKAIEVKLLPFPPYSDFTFTSLYTYNTNRSVEISTLHGNLVVKFEDYLDRQPFYSFLGSHKVIDTADKLLNYNIETFETYMHALWEGFMKSCSNFKEEVC